MSVRSFWGLKIEKRTDQSRRKEDSNIAKALQSGLRAIMHVAPPPGRQAWLVEQGQVKTQRQAISTWHVSNPEGQEAGDASAYPILMGSPLPTMVMALVEALAVAPLSQLGDRKNGDGSPNEDGG
jgi:hypothetical protein